MRFSNWDVLLFPESEDENKVPLQEFRTVCEVVEDPSADQMPPSSHPAYFSTVTRPVPIVSCFVPSLPHGCPFMVSVHSWTPPAPSAATASMSPREGLIAFEAKVLVDGVCLADAVFDKSHTWPQIIDTMSSDKGTTDQLRFPPFYTEMLTQAWVVPAQTLGRVKVIIAEGMKTGPDASGFEKIRNIVAFSFQHAPLPILEDTNIAWPNQSIWYQSAQQFYNPLSPRKMNEAGLDSHAYLPRRESLKNESVRSEISSIAPPRMSGGLPEPSAFRPLAVPSTLLGGYSNDPFVSPWQTTQWEPWKNTMRNTWKTGNDAMPGQKTPFPSGHDQSLPNLSRPLSPLSLQSHEMPDYSCPLSAASKSISDWERPLHEAMRSNGGTSDNNDGENRPPMSDQDHPSEEHTSQFTEMMAELSPSRTVTSGTFAPTNSRVNSADTLTPPKIRLSAARPLSYSGKAQTVSDTKWDPPAPGTSRSETLNATTNKFSTVIKKRASGKMRNREEGQSSEIGSNSAYTAQRQSGGSPNSAKDGSNESLVAGDKKRRKIAPGELGVPLGLRRQHIENLSPKPDVRSKLGEDHKLHPDLEDEVVTIRTPLRSLENSM